MRFTIFTISGLFAAFLMAVATLVSLLATTTPSEGAERCIRIQRQGNIETLVNVCMTCIVARIIRSRPGNDVPVARQFSVQPRNTMPTSFKGPGRSRVKSERPCPGQEPPKSTLKTESTRPGAPRCVSMTGQTPTGVVMSNNCNSCRAVAVVRVSADGNSQARDYFQIEAGKRVGVAANGYAQIGLLAEIACP